MEKTFVLGELIVAYEHDKVIPPPYPPRRLYDVVTGKGKIKRIKYGEYDKEEETQKPGKEEQIRSSVVF
jgi:hypothetical protein